MISMAAWCTVVESMMHVDMLATDRRCTKHVVQMFGAEDGSESTPADPHQAAARRKQLVFELNKNGQYLRLKEQLKAAVIGIVKDSYHKSGGMGREEMQASLCLAIHLYSCQRITCRLPAGACHVSARAFCRLGISLPLAIA